MKAVSYESTLKGDGSEEHQVLGGYDLDGSLPRARSRLVGLWENRYVALGSSGGTLPIPRQRAAGSADRLSTLLLSAHFIRRVSL